MKLRLPIAAVAALILVASTAALIGCSKNKSTNPTPTPESFDSGDLAMGVPFLHTFNTAGTYAYRCLHHSTSLTSGMVGSVIVVDNYGVVGTSVSVASNSFTPASVTIKTGSIVTWNLANGTHTVTRP